MPTVAPGKYYLVAERGSVDYSISKLNINDTGNYTIVATNNYVTKSVTYDLRPLGKSLFVYIQGAKILWVLMSDCIFL